jgi:hypothetical protein
MLTCTSTNRRYFGKLIPRFSGFFLLSFCLLQLPTRALPTVLPPIRATVWSSSWAESPQSVLCPVKSCASPFPIQGLTNPATHVGKQLERR